MIFCIMNKDHICQLCMGMHAFEKEIEFDNFQF